MVATTRSKAKASNERSVTKRKQEWIYGYKGFRSGEVDGGLVCQRYSFGCPRRGTVVADSKCLPNKTPILCRRGFHFCQNPNYIEDFYSSNDPFTVYCLIRAKKEDVVSDSYKSAARSIQFLEHAWRPIKDLVKGYSCITTDELGNTRKWVDGKIVEVNGIKLPTKIEARKEPTCLCKQCLPIVHRIEYNQHGIKMIKNRGTDYWINDFSFGNLAALDRVFKCEPAFFKPLATSLKYGSWSIFDIETFKDAFGVEPLIVETDNNRIHIELLSEPECMIRAREEMERLDELAESHRQDTSSEEALPISRRD